MKRTLIDPTSRDRKIIEIARREVSCEHVAEFEPITRGPIFAVLGLSMMAFIAGIYWVGNIIAKIAGQGSKT